MGSNRKPEVVQNFTASGAIGANLAVYLSGAGVAVLSTAGTDLGVGINGPGATADGAVAAVTLLGVEEAIAGAAVLVGKALMATTGGKLVHATAAAGTVVRVLGYALSAAAADGDRINVFVCPHDSQIAD